MTFQITSDIVNHNTEADDPWGSVKSQSAVVWQLGLEMGQVIKGRCKQEGAAPETEWGNRHILLMRLSEQSWVCYCRLPPSLGIPLTVMGSLTIPTTTT